MLLAWLLVQKLLALESVRPVLGLALRLELLLHVVITVVALIPTKTLVHELISAAHLVVGKILLAIAVPIVIHP